MKYTSLGSRFGLSVLASTACFVSGMAAAAPASDAVTPVAGAVQTLQETLLPKAMNGEAAFYALSPVNRVLVATRLGVTVDKLLWWLRFDQSMWLDRNGYLFYVDPPRDQSSGSAAAATLSAPPLPAPLENTFKLHSRKQSATGASRVIYLDFTGYNLPAGTTWNGGNAFQAPAYDTDGNPASFNEAERTHIQWVWQSVSEAYSPFDVDVTTEEPPQSDITRDDANDLRYGTRVVFTPAAGNPVATPVGGRSIAFVGAFDAYPGIMGRSHDYSQPAWVFVANPSNGEPNASIFDGSAGSHETGHTLGLKHDGDTRDSYYLGHGSGATSWSPIMGSGNKAVNQWSKGEYPGYQSLQLDPDDYAVMASHGVSVRSDDYGNLSAAAAPLKATKAANGRYEITQIGVIEAPADVDYFSFSSGEGTLDLQLSPAYVGPMLDGYIGVYGSGGSLIAEANDPDGTGANLSVKLQKGKYFIRVDGVGDKDPLPGYPDYGSLGQYRLTGSYADAGNAPPLAVAKGDKTSGNAALTVQFSSAGSKDPEGTAIRYLWDFGDGTATSSVVSPSHVYGAAGLYSAKLTVTDTTGLSGSAVLPIRVYASTGPDTKPDPFYFPNFRNRDFNVLALGSTTNSAGSALQNLTGFDAPASITIMGGEYSIAGRAFTSAPGTINPGESLQVRHLTSSKSQTTVTTTVTIGGDAGTKGYFSTTTKTADTTPDSFAFAAQDKVPLNAQVTSAPVTIRGFNTSTAISVVGGEYRIGDDGPWTAASGLINPNPATLQFTPSQVVRVRHKTPNAGAVKTNTTLTIGGVSATFTSTTVTLLEGGPLLADNQPDQFTFVDKVGVAKGSIIESAGVKLTGMSLNGTATLSITGGQFKVVKAISNPDTETWRHEGGTVVNGDTIYVRSTSSSAANTRVDTVVKIGNVSDTFSVTTGP